MLPAVLQAYVRSQAIVVGLGPGVPWKRVDDIAAVVAEWPVDDVVQQVPCVVCHADVTVFPSDAFIVGVAPLVFQAFGDPLDKLVERSCERLVSGAVAVRARR